jgi:hypothetical protein
MLQKLTITMCILGLLSPGAASAVSDEDFKVQATENLLNLCAASPDDLLYDAAINFCHGFMLGAYHYHLAEARGPKGNKLVCPPDPRPSRSEVVKMFVQWTKERPQYWKEEAVETEFRFLIETWPCNP